MCLIYCGEPSLNHSYFNQPQLKWYTYPKLGHRKGNLHHQYFENYDGYGVRKISFYIYTKKCFFLRSVCILDYCVGPNVSGCYVESEREGNVHLKNLLSECPAVLCILYYNK